MSKIYYQQNSNGNAVYSTFGNGKFSGGEGGPVLDYIYSQIQAGIDAACFISIKPSLSNTVAERNSLVSFLSSLASHGFNSANCYITFWQEPNGAPNTVFPNGDTYLNWVNYYWLGGGGAAKAVGFKLFYDPAIGGNSNATILSFYTSGTVTGSVGPALFDGICVDYYGSSYDNNNSIDFLVQQANTDGIMWSIGEWGEVGKPTNIPCTQAQWNGPNDPITTYTATHASPCVFSLPSGKSWPNGTTVRILDSAPGGFQTDNRYWVVGSSGNTFNLSATQGGAAINSTTAITSPTAIVGGYLPYLVAECQRATHGVPFALYFNGINTNPNNIVPTMQTSYSKTPGFQYLYDALNGTTTGGGGGTGDSSVYADAYTDSYAGAVVTGGGGTPGLQPIAGGPYFITSLGTSSGTALPMPVPINTNSGDNLVVGVSVGTAAVTPAVTDTAGNTYALSGHDVTETGAQLWVFEATASSPLLGGTDVITVSTNAASAISAIAVGDPNVGSSVFAIAHGSSTAPSVTETLPSAVEDNCIAFIADTTAGGNPAWGGSWQSLVSQGDGGSHLILSAAVLQPVNVTTATASGTITSAPWTAGILGEAIGGPAQTSVVSDGVVGVPYSQTLESSGGVGAVTWSILSGALPSGLSLTANVISGTPTAGGSSTFLLAVTDANGVTTSVSVTITILAVTPGIPLLQLPTNLLSTADSTFEAGAGTWAAVQNANAPQVSPSIALAGSQSLYWTSAADGATSITTASYPVTGGLPYILSAGLLTTSNASPNLILEIDWYDSGGNLLEADSNSAASAVPLTWSPVALTATAPTNAVTANVIIAVDASNAGDSNFADLVFLTQTAAQVVVDWTNAPFQPGSTAGAAFMDVSPWLRLDGNGITFTRGRQDAISEIQPSSGSFSLQNDQGQFARESTDSLPVAFGGAVTLQRRVQVNLADENGLWYTRFDGNISEIDYEFDNTGNTSLATVSLTDVLAYLNRQDPLACWTKQQVLSDGPLYHWSLDDPGTLGGAGIAAETSGNNGPPMRLVSSDSTGTATISWQDTSAGVETLADAANATGSDGSEYWSGVAGANQPSSQLRGLDPGNVGPFTAPIGSVLFTPKQTAQSSQNTFVGGTGYQLVTELSSPLAPTATGSDYSIECWIMPDTSLVTGMALNNGPYIALGLGSSRTKTNLLAGIFLNAGTATFKCATYSQPPAFLGLNWPGATTPSAVASTSASFTPDVNKRPHHLVITIQGDPSAAAVSMYLDGNEIGSGFTLPTGQTYDTICIGGAYGGCGAWFGNISLASIYPFVLSSQQIIQHCQMGQYGMWENTTDDCIAQLATFAAIPPFWSDLGAQHQGLSMTDYFDISGSNALAAMQQYEAAERGLLYVDSAGQVNFFPRSFRMGYGAPDLLLPEDTFGGTDLGYKVIDQFMVNEEGISGPNTLGATATTLLSNPATGQTSTQTSVSTVIQSGFVNSESQDQYGVYAQNPISSPLSLPLITWTRGYAALGLPSYSYAPDPNLTDRAAWDANAQAEPWAFPASVTVDLLTLDPLAGLAISDFYGLDIGNMIAPAPGTLPPSFPDAQTSVEWFIEGMTETITVSSHTLQLYTSPAEWQRAWIPGDATYGVLGATTRLGISAADTSVPQADGKDVSHDAGGPYWPPAFSARMNAPAVPQGVFPANEGGFVGAADLRGIAQNLQTMLQPPLCVAQALTETQSFASGALSGTSPPNVSSLFWDVVQVDTAGGMGAVPGWPNWYLVTQAGFYEIDACVTWSLGATGQAGFTGQAWIIVAQAAAQAIAAGTGNPLTVNQYVCPVGEATQFTNASMTPICAPSTRMYLGVGDMVCIGAEQNLGSAKGTSTSQAGSMMSIRFAGLGTTDDRTLINTSLASGGSVSLVSHGPVMQSTFFNTHTYSYGGKNAITPYARQNSDTTCHQGYTPQSGQNGGGSRTAQIAFNTSAITAALAGHTVLSATLTATNIGTYYQGGGRAIIGWTTDTPGRATFNAQDSNSKSWQMEEWFNQGATKTFTIPITIVQALNTGGAKALILGNSNITNPLYYGSWNGGPSSWTLEVNYR